MATDCTADSLAISAACFYGMTPIQMQAARVTLLCNYLNGVTMTCDPSTILASAACYLGMSPIQLSGVETWLVCQVTNGGSGGSGSVLVQNFGGVAPGVTPTGQAVAFDTGTGAEWAFDGTSWIQFTAGA